MSSNPAPESASANARGRTVASKPLSASATRSAGISTSASTTGKLKRTPSTASSSSKTSSTSAKAAKAGTASSSRASSRGSESGGGGFKVTKLSSTTVTLNTTWTHRPPQPVTSSASGSSLASKSQSVAPPLPTSSVAEEQPTRTTDPLQVAAQVYPWTYMTSTLDACFKDAEKAATNDLETRTNQLAEEEFEVAEQRDRMDAERALDFFEELGTGAFGKEAPEIMQLFHTHGDSCARVETEALQLALRNGTDSDDEEPLKVYNDMLQVLEELHQEATSLQASIIKLTEASPSSFPPTNPTSTTAEPEQGEGEGDDSLSRTPDTNPTAITPETSIAHSQVSNVFASCLPVLRARIANITMAQELIDTAMENVTLGLRMESMGIA